MFPNLLVDVDPEEDQGSGAEQKDFQEGVNFVKALHGTLHFSLRVLGS